jgi:hypothetical protein
MGLDGAYEISRKGFLFPDGDRAKCVMTTERRLNACAGQPGPRLHLPHDGH